MKIKNTAQISAWLPHRYIERDFHDKFVASLDLPEVTVLYGARQVGKSAEITRCMSSILEKDESADVFYFNLDVVGADFESPDRFVNLLLAQKINTQAKTYVFIDEAQRLANVGLFVKYIYDQHLNIKFILTGSASLEIKQKVKEPLTGRKIEFFLPSLSLAEILRFNGIDPVRIGGSFDLTDRLLEEYMLYGGYPSVVTAQDPSEKKRKLLEIADSYVTRDVLDQFGITNKDTLLLVATYLARNTGGILSKDNLGQIAGVSKYEIEKVLVALEKSFIVFAVKPFARDRVKEMVHRPKLYFRDVGIRNALLGRIDKMLVVGDRGVLFENCVGIWLVGIFGADKVKYWRTKNQTEVDFVVLNEAERVSVFESKYSYSGNGLPRNVSSFRERYRQVLNKARVVSKENYWIIWK